MLFYTVVTMFSIGDLPPLALIAMVGFCIFVIWGAGKWLCDIYAALGWIDSPELTHSLEPTYVP